MEIRKENIWVARVILMYAKVHYSARDSLISNFSNIESSVRNGNFLNFPFVSTNVTRRWQILFTEEVILRARDCQEFVCFKELTSLEVSTLQKSSSASEDMPKVQQLIGRWRSWRGRAWNETTQKNIWLKNGFVGSSLIVRMREL